MSFFLLTFFLIYGGFHCYAFWKAHAALRFGPVAGSMLATFMLIMVLAPAAVRFLEWAGQEGAAKVLAFAGYMWMGALFFFVVAGVLVDCCRLLAAGLGAASGTAGLFSSLAFFVPLGAALIFSAYGFFEAMLIRAETVTLASSKISATAGRLRIVQISDVHLGLMVRKERLARILATVRALAPDILVCTGDLVDGQLDDIQDLAAMFAEIRPRYGKYAVTGNHEFYAGLDQALRFMRTAGFTVLRNEWQAVAPGLVLAGVDDRAVDHFESRQAGGEAELLATLPAGLYTVLLKHRPKVENASLGRFDLQLSGHTHQGQMFPFSLLTRLFFPLHAGGYPLAGGSYLYVSRGSGTWGPPIRFLAPPEVTLIELIPAAGQ